MSEGAHILTGIAGDKTSLCGVPYANAFFQDTGHVVRSYKGGITACAACVREAKRRLDAVSEESAPVGEVDLDALDALVAEAAGLKAPRWYNLDALQRAGAIGIEIAEAYPAIVSELRAYRRLRCGRCGAELGAPMEEINDRRCPT